MTDLCTDEPMTLDYIRNLPFLTTAQTARLFEIDEDSARKAFAAGQIPAVRIGRLWRVPVPKLLAMLGETGQPEAA